jgi:hypothetical protein
MQKLSLDNTVNLRYIANWINRIESKLGIPVTAIPITDIKLDSVLGKIMNSLSEISNAMNKREIEEK